ncbi:hypothetical protein [Polycladidibacter stylochi]|uniref:hypothetical protein n=1 Tax=Polycladidibacter stylochi TaxID=1807766 RepID=UPI00082FFF50|nr:hypothetical protein [Pseudovibrio stylochi]
MRNFFIIFLLFISSCRTYDYQTDSGRPEILYNTEAQQTKRLLIEKLTKHNFIIETQTKNAIYVIIPPEKKLELYKYASIIPENEYTLHIILVPKGIKTRVITNLTTTFEEGTQNEQVISAMTPQSQKSIKRWLELPSRIPDGH